MLVSISMISLSVLFPKKPPYREPVPVDIESPINEINESDRIKVHTGVSIQIASTGMPRRSSKRARRAHNWKP